MAFFMRLFSLLLALLLTLTSCSGVFYTDSFQNRWESFFDDLRPLPHEQESIPSSSESREPEAPVDSIQDNLPAPEEDWVFSDLQYERPDFDAVFAQIQACLDLCEQNADFDTLSAAYDRMEPLYEDVMMAYALAELYYSLDITDQARSDELDYMQEQVRLLSLRGNELDMALLDSPIGSQVADDWGEEAVAQVRLTARMQSEDILALQQQENALTYAYDALYNNCTVTYRGRQWTLASMYADATLGQQEFYELYDLLLDKFNQEAGGIYLELVALRDEIADTLGYDSYAQYGYDYYGRDFTPEDAQMLCDTVKEKLSPLFCDLFWELYDEDMQRYYQQTFSSSLPLEVLGTFAQDTDPRMREAFSQMIGHEMYDLTSGEKKQTGGFTTFIDGVNLPFLFINWDGSCHMPATLQHEFGHFLSFYCQRDSESGVNYSIDLAEIDSQAFELLAMETYGELFGSLADTARAARLLSVLQSIISGCIEDEFQRAVYAQPDMTLEQMNELYGSLIEEYRYGEIYVMSDRSWVEIPHTFSSPMYYISYAVSAVPALELYLRSQEDWSGVVAQYMQFICEREAYDTFAETLDRYDLIDPFQAQDLDTLFDTLALYCRGELELAG